MYVFSRSQWLETIIWAAGLTLYLGFVLIFGSLSSYGVFYYIILGVTTFIAARHVIRGATSWRRSNKLDNALYESIYQRLTQIRKAGEGEDLDCRIEDSNPIRVDVIWYKKWPFRFCEVRVFSMDEEDVLATRVIYSFPATYGYVWRHFDASVDVVDRGDVWRASFKGRDTISLRESLLAYESWRRDAKEHPELHAATRQDLGELDTLLSISEQ